VRPGGEDGADEGVVVVRAGRPAGIERLIGALTRVLGAEPASSGPDRARSAGLPGLEFVDSRPLVRAWVLDGLWHRLGIHALLRCLGAVARRDPIVKRGLFALVASRGLAPTSKLAATSWVAHDVHIPGLDPVGNKLIPEARRLHQLITAVTRNARQCSAGHTAGEMTAMASTGRTSIQARADREGERHRATPHASEPARPDPSVTGRCPGSTRRRAGSAGGRRTIPLHPT
jgi:hypothetical protein